MKAILTKHLSATNTLPHRIKAWDDDGNKVIVFNRHNLGGEDNHKRAAIELCEKLHLTTTRLLGGPIKDGYAFITEIVGHKI